MNSIDIAARAIVFFDGPTGDRLVEAAHEATDIEKLSAPFCQLSGISRVAYDISSKPPATIEWE